MCTVSYAGRSDTGRQRSANQDRWGVDAEQGLYMVADGVAGSSDGALAAQLVIELLPEYLRRRKPEVDDAADQLRAAVGELSDDLHTQGQSDPSIAGAESDRADAGQAVHDQAAGARPRRRQARGRLQAGALRREGGEVANPATSPVVSY